MNDHKACLDALNLGDWDVFMLAGRYTLLEQAPVEDLLPICLERNIAVCAAGPFNSGILAGETTWNYKTAPPHIVDRVRRLAEVCGAVRRTHDRCCDAIPLGSRGGIICNSGPFHRRAT